MSKESSDTQHPVGVIDATEDGRLRVILVTGTISLVLTLAVAILRLYRLNELPPGLFFDEGSHGVNALQVLQGEHTVFFPDNHGREGMIVYAVALATSLLGRTPMAVRLPTALASAGTVLVVFWLGMLLFGRDERGQSNPWRGLLIGGVGAGLLAVSLSQTIIGRTAFRGNFLPFQLSLCLAMLWWGWGQRSWWRVTLAGACAGLLPYTYIPARFTPFLFLFFGLSFALPLCSATWERLRGELPWATIFAGVTALVAAPILTYFALFPEHFFMRSSHLWVFDSSLSHGDPLGTFLANVWEHLLAFGIRGDPHWRHNFANRPMLNPWEAVFFWIGVGMAAWHWQRWPAYRLLLLWLGTLLLSAMLARDDLVPHFLRMIGAAPAVYLLTGVGIWETYRLLRDRWGLTRVFGGDGARVTIALGAVVGSMVLLQGANTFRAYFQKWAATPELYEVYESELVDAARVLNAQLPAAGMAYLIPYRVNGHPSFDYIFQGTSPAHVVHANMPHLARRIESMLSAMDNVSTVKVVDWNHDSAWTGRGDENIIVLMGKYGRYLSSEEFADFRIHTYTNISLDRPWTFYEYLEPVTVHYDGGIDLVGLALGQSGEQLSSRYLLDLGSIRSLWVGMQWETTPDLNTDFAVSLRLYDSQGAMSYQSDSVLGNPNHARTSHWLADEVVDTLSFLYFPDELPSGEYELRLIVYDTETLIPTVKIDVWEPELVLARLRLAKGR